MAEMKFDEILTKYLGEFGAYQRKVYFLLCLPAIWSSIIIYAWTFIGADIPHRCKMSPDDLNFSSFVNLSTTLNTTETAHSNTVFNLKVQQRNVIGVYHYFTGKSEDCIYGYVFDNSDMAPSAVQEWLLVCGQQWWLAIVQSLFYMGIFFGSLVQGFLADKFGRKAVILVSSFLITCLMLASTLSSNVIMFAVFRFVHGFLEPALWQVPFAIALELVGPSKRVIAGMVIEFFFTAGIVLLGCIAYFVRNWRTLQIVIAAPGFLFLSYYWLIPESPRWLLATGRKKEAVQVLRTCAKYNKVTIPEEVLQTLLEGDKSETATAKSVERTYSYWDLFRTPNMRRKTLICCYCWSIVVLIYYGISLNPSAIAGNFYVAFILGGAFEVPSLIFVILLLDRLGRKFLQSGGFLLSGLPLIAIVVLPNGLEPLPLILVLLAQSMVTAAFCVIYIHTSEIFPTVLRGTALGLLVTCSRIGGIISPLASTFLKHEHKNIILTAFGVLAVVAGLMSLMLPETTYKRLPETLEDGENFGKGMSFSCAPKICYKANNQGTEG